MNSLGKFTEPVVGIKRQSKDLSAPPEKTRRDSEPIYWSGVQVCNDVISKVASYLLPKDVVNTIELLSRSHQDSTHGYWQGKLQEMKYHFDWSDLAVIYNDKYKYVLVRLFVDYIYNGRIIFDVKSREKIDRSFKGIFAKCPNFKKYYDCFKERKDKESITFDTTFPGDRLFRCVFELNPKKLNKEKLNEVLQDIQEMINQKITFAANLIAGSVLFKVDTGYCRNTHPDKEFLDKFIVDASSFALSAAKQGDFLPLNHYIDNIFYKLGKNTQVHLTSEAERNLFEFLLKGSSLKEKEYTFAFCKFVENSAKDLMGNAKFHDAIRGKDDKLVQKFEQFIENNKNETLSPALFFSTGILCLRSAPIVMVADTPDISLQKRTKLFQKGIAFCQKAIELYGDAISCDALYTMIVHSSFFSHHIDLSKEKLLEMMKPCVAIWEKLFSKIDSKALEQQDEKSRMFLSNLNFHFVDAYNICARLDPAFSEVFELFVKLFKTYPQPNYRSNQFTY